jgi:hypothetical protein
MRWTRLFTEVYKDEPPQVINLSLQYQPVSADQHHGSLPEPGT